MSIVLPFGSTAKETTQFNNRKRIIEVMKKRSNGTHFSSQLAISLSVLYSYSLC